MFDHHCQHKAIKRKNEGTISVSTSKRVILNGQELIETQIKLEYGLWNAQSLMEQLYLTLSLPRFRRYGRSGERLCKVVLKEDTGKITSSAYDRAITLMNSQLLHLTRQGLNKIKPMQVNLMQHSINIISQIGVHIQQCWANEFRQ